MRIIGPPTAEHSVVRPRLVEAGATSLFLNEIFPAVWSTALQYAVDPVGAVAQSFKETGGGRFGGRVKPQFHNTCGLKIRDLRPRRTVGPVVHVRARDRSVGRAAVHPDLRNGDLMEYTRELPGDTPDGVVTEVVEHVRAELSARADADDDPTTRAEDVRVRVDRQDDLITVIGELDAEPDAPYLHDDFDPFDGVPDELRAHARNDEVTR